MEEQGTIRKFDIVTPSSGKFAGVVFGIIKDIHTDRSDARPEDYLEHPNSICSLDNGSRRRASG